MAVEYGEDDGYLSSMVGRVDASSNVGDGDDAIAVADGERDVDFVENSDAH